MKKPLIAPNKLSRPVKNYLGKEGLEKLLKQHFGYSGFREKQLEAIEASLSGRDCFCLMPTGGGKSMCYQIPALATSGIVLVISPLIALMENQVMALKANGVCANFLSSTQLACIKEKIHEDLNSEKPSVKLLYVTPELVATSGFTVKLINLYNRGLLSLIAVDEAHCISTWGHDFRPSYRKLSSLRSHIPGVPIIALTATAVSKVQEDVIKSLQLQNPLILRTSFNRPNIYYEDEAMVAECSARSKISSKATPDEKFEALQRAEEIYYQNKVQNKQVKRGLADRNIISQALREASKKRLLNALNQAKERLRNHSFDVDASSVSLELDCFKKYEKVGKTFYNSQVAATVRWLSSANSEQISERLGQNSATCDAENKPKVLENAATSSSSSIPANQLLVQPVGEEQVKDEVLEENACEAAAMEFSHGKVNLPPIPSFSEFVSLKSKRQERTPSIGSGSAPKRRAEADMNGRIHVDKKKKHNQNIV